MNSTAALIVRGVITFTLICGVGGIFFMLATHEIPVNNKDQVWALVGTVGVLATQSITWWYGSSKGSSDKTELLKA